MRKQNWTEILNDKIEYFKTQEFKWGVNDCVQFALQTAVAIYDIPELKQKLAKETYDTEKGAYEMLERMGGFYDGLDKYFKRKCIKFIHRGDIALVKWQDKKIAGIVDLTGRRVACMGLEGIYFVPLKFAIAGWEV